MGYSSHSADMRVDFFQARGKSMKWYTTEAVRMLVWNGQGESGKSLDEAFLESVVAHLDATPNEGQDVHHRRLAGMVAICIEPYHEFACPISVIVPRKIKIEFHSQENVNEHGFATGGPLSPGVAAAMAIGERRRMRS